LHSEQVNAQEQAKEAIYGYWKTAQQAVTVTIVASKNGPKATIN